MALALLPAHPTVERHGSSTRCQRGRARCWCPARPATAVRCSAAGYGRSRRFGGGVAGETLTC